LADAGTRQKDDPASGGALDARQQRDLGSLAHRLHENHPDVPLSVLTQMVESEFAQLAQSRVQSFRMILIERAVRRRLASAHDRART
jgi:hypothetical protein